MKRIEKTCPICSKPFSVPLCHSSRYLTCGYKCGGIYRRKKIITNICAFCKKEFISKKQPTLPQKFCSRYCGAKSRKVGEKAKCKNCFSDIYIPLHKIKGPLRKIYCSNKCRLEDWNQRSLSAQMPGSYRENAWKTYEKKCYDCGLQDDRVLVIHHVDGNRKNGKIENLIPVCHNCHCIRHFKMSGDNRVPSYKGSD